MLEFRPGQGLGKGQWSQKKEKPRKAQDDTKQIRAFEREVQTMILSCGKIKAVVEGIAVLKQDADV